MDLETYVHVLAPSAQVALRLSMRPSRAIVLIAVGSHNLCFGLFAGAPVLW